MANPRIEARQRRELESLLKPWLTTLSQRSAHTARAYEHAVEDFLVCIPDGPVSPEHVATYLDSLSDPNRERGPLTPASRAHHISAVRAFLRFAQRQSALKTSLGSIATSLLDYLQRPKVTVTSFNRYLDEAELRQLIAAARELGPYHYAAIVLLAGTGIRVGEAATARWRDIFADPQGRIGLRVLGKGQKERVVRLRQDVFDALIALHGSSEIDERDTAPLLPAPVATNSRPALGELAGARQSRDLDQKTAAAQLGVTQAWLSRIESGTRPATPVAQQQLADFYGVAIDELFAPAKLTAGRAYSVRDLERLVHDASTRSSLKKRVSPHWLRHTHLTLAALGGASTFAIQASAGHARLETSARYVHWAKGLADTTVDSLPSFT